MLRLLFIPFKGTWRFKSRRGFPALLRIWGIDWSTSNRFLISINIYHDLSCIIMKLSRPLWIPEAKRILNTLRKVVNWICINWINLFVNLHDNVSLNHMPKIRPCWIASSFSWKWRSHLVPLRIPLSTQLASLIHERQLFLN